MPLARSLCRSFRFLTPLHLVLILTLMHGGAAARQLPAPDSLSRRQLDSLRAEEIKKRYIPFVGNLGRPIDSTSALDSRQFMHSDANYVGDLLWKVPGVFLRELGEPGQPAQLSVTGVDNRGISLLLDGRPLNDPVNGGYNLYDLPIEYVIEIESFDGSGSLLQAPNSPGGAFNFVSHEYNNNRPMTKLRFLQGPYDHILSDGIFAQNISPGMNAMFGFQRHVTDGRFQNSAYDSWNYRLRLRYNLSEQLNLWAGDFYTKSTIGLNGGVNPDLSPSVYDEVTAIARDTTTYQIVSRHDPTLGIVGRFLADSASLSKVLIYYSSIDREYTIGGGGGAQPVFSDHQGSSFWGTKLQQRLELPGSAFDVGAQYEKRSVDQSHYLSGRSEKYLGITGRATFQPLDLAKIAFSARYEKLRGDNALSRGVNLEASLTDWLSIRGDYSKSYRFPTIQELYWTDSTVRRIGSPTKEAHSLLQLGLSFRSGPATLTLAGFQRKIESPIIFSRTGILDDASSITISQLPDEEMTGGTADLRLQIWHLVLAGNATYTNSRQSGLASRFIPRFTSTSELAYWNQFFNGGLDLKVAIRVKAVSNHDALEFVPQLLAYAQQSSTDIPGFTSLDFYTVAKLGDAYLLLVWENPLNVNAMVVPYYPLMGRNIKMGVNWVFTD